MTAPDLNGKAECSHRLGDQGLRQFIDQDGTSDDIRLRNEKLREWRTSTIIIVRTGRCGGRPSLNG